MTCPAISALKFPCKYISTGPITANTIRPTIVPSTRLSRNPSCTHRPLPNFCAIVTPCNELDCMIHDGSPSPRTRGVLVHYIEGQRGEPANRRLVVVADQRL